jgi:hypothetical protein
VVNSLPLEFRGSDHVSARDPRLYQPTSLPFLTTTQTLRTQIETVIEALMGNPEKGYKGQWPPTPPSPRPRANDHAQRATSYACQS